MSHVGVSWAEPKPTLKRSHQISTLLNSERLTLAGISSNRRCRHTHLAGELHPRQSAISSLPINRPVELAEVEQVLSGFH